MLQIKNTTWTNKYNDWKISWSLIVRPFSTWKNISGLVMKFCYITIHMAWRTHQIQVAWKYSNNICEWHGICSKDFFLIPWAPSLGMHLVFITCSPVNVIDLTCHKNIRFNKFQWNRHKSTRKKWATHSKTYHTTNISLTIIIT